MADALLEFFRAIAARDHSEVGRRLDASSALAATAIRVGASRQDAENYFLVEIQHYVYAGDTALHIAAASYDSTSAEALVANGAEVRAGNRRGAEPIHYAADGSPGSPLWDPDAPGAVVEYLIAHGADPDATDNSGVAALHRAVRTRSTGAVRALLENGADPRLPNKRGSTPLDLAGRTTGRGGSGSAAAKAEQQKVIDLLLEHGAGRAGGRVD